MSKSRGLRRPDRLRRLTLGLATLCLLAGCALLPAPEEEVTSRPSDPDEFARLVRESLQEHQWQALIVGTEPTLYQARVVDDGTPEPEFLASLLGLDQEGNTIQDGDEFDWEDYERIQLAGLAPTGGSGPPHHYTGEVTLTDGTTRRLTAWVTMIRGRFVLTSPPASD